MHHHLSEDLAPQQSRESSLQSRRGFGSLALLCMSASGALALAACGRVAPSQGADNAPTPRPPLRIRSSGNTRSDAGASASEAQGAALLQVYQQVSQQMHGFVTGNPNSEFVVYGVVDPMCPHCGNFWIQSRTLWDRVKFVWLPVPMLGKNSLINGALILGSKDPADAMNVHEYKLLNELPPLVPVPEVVEAGRAKIVHNGDVAKAIKLDSVPLIMTQRKSGEVVMTVGGIGAPEILQLIG